jgi:Helix-hairpin-helix motif
MWAQAYQETGGMVHPYVPMSADPGRGQKSKWPFFSLVPLGLGAWAPIYAGVKARRGTWSALGAIWSAIVVAGWVISTQHRHANSFAGFVIILGWIGAIATSFSIRPAYDRQMDSPLEAATETGQARMRERANAIEMARRNPALAREIGIGRPDLPGTTDAGLVDVNNASVTALLKLPGVDGDLATEIVETREKVDGFSSLEDLGETLDLDGGLVERLRGQVVFLPR